jgi:hypothetical protein
MAAQVAWALSNAMDKSRHGTPFSHGASPPTDGTSTRLTSVATTEATTSTDQALSSDDDVGGSIGSILKPWKQFVPEVVIQTKAIDTEANFRHPFSPHKTEALNTSDSEGAEEDLIAARQVMVSATNTIWKQAESATCIIREQAESIQKCRGQLLNQIDRTDKLLFDISTVQELKPQHSPVYQHIWQAQCGLVDSTTAFPQDTPAVRYRSCSPMVSEAKLLGVAQGRRYVYLASPRQSWPSKAANNESPLAPGRANGNSALCQSGREDIDRAAHDHKIKLDGARLDLAQAVEAAQRARAAQPEISILTAARDQLLADLAHARDLGVPREELASAEQQRRKLHNAIQDLKGQVRVFCRVRPQTATEKLEEDSEMLRVLDGDCVESPLTGAFFFNGVFAPGTQEVIFDECKDLAQSAVDGHNVTIFSYGQTGAGKTFTMYGTPREEGLATRMADELFNVLDGLRDSYTFEVEGSIAEIYNNGLFDLSNPDGRRLIERPKLRQGKEGHVQIDDLSQWKVSNGKHLKELIEHGFTLRSAAETVMNDQSSRSHLILTVKLVRTDKATGEARTSKMVFCDLAGSERLKKTEAVGTRKKEAIEINKSLAALGDVIEAVAAKRKHVPYRNHTLTRILHDSLGGTAKTLMFVHCSPARSSAPETAMSLKFAARAGRIINTACTRPGSCQSRSNSV